MIHYVAVQLRDRLRVLDKALRHGQPGSEEVLHDVRVAARRLLQAIRLFADFLDARRVKQMRRRLRQLTERCGAVRDCDIALAILAAAGCDDAEPREHITALRQTRQDELSCHLRGRHSVQRWRRFLVPLQPSPRMVTAAAFAHRTLPRMLDKLFASGAQAVADGTEPALHHFRLLAKRFRYTLELFAEVYGPGTQKCLHALAALQDRLGAMQDCTASLTLTGHNPRIQRLLETRRRSFAQYWKTFRKHHASWKPWLNGD